MALICGRTACCACAVTVQKPRFCPWSRFSCPGCITWKTFWPHTALYLSLIHIFPLVADARLVLEELCETCQATDTSMWLAELREKQGVGAPFSDRPSFVNPHRLIAALTKALDSDAVYVADVGLNQIWSARSANIKDGRFLTCLLYTSRCV